MTARRVDESSYDEFILVLMQSGLPSNVSEAAFPRSLVRDDALALFIAHLDGKPAGTSVLVRTGDVCGIYAVATVEDARRRGVGTAVTWAAVEQARTWGSDAALLQATAMGYPVYAAMGFRTVTHVAMFRRPPTESAHQDSGAQVTQ